MKMDDTKRSLVVAQDIKLVKALAGNNAKVRDRALKNLRKWLEHRSQKIPFTESEFLRIWKGLFYAMWMSDKPLVQEECAEKIAHLVHFPNVETSLLFFKCSLIVLATEWFGIDQLRLDKFLMFARRVLRQALFVLKNNNWKVEAVIKFGEILFETILQSDNDNNHIGLTMHIIEIYLEELAKVSKGEINSSLMTKLLRPFVKLLATLNDVRLIGHIKKYLFHHLLQQSDQGIEYQVKFQAWKGEGFPGGTIDSMQNVRDFNDVTCSDEEIDDQILDPRAGQVDVVLPQLKFRAKEISKLLLEYKFADGSTTKSRKAVTDLAKQFGQLSKGKFPLGMKKIEIPNDDGYSTNIKKSVNRFVKFEKQLLGNNRKRKLKDKKNDSELPPPKRNKIDVDLKRKRSEIDNHSHMDIGDSSGFFKTKLENFIRKSESGTLHKIRKAKTARMVRKPVKNGSALIQRNSGIWLVEPLDTSQDSHNSSIENTEPFSVFPQNEWDLPPNEGEVEIFVPSNKYKRKIENIAKKSGKSSPHLIKESIEKLVKPPRYSLDSRLVKNPFSHKNFVTPKSEKKVKINLKLNSSQEIYEHRAQLRRSPAIPFDANKKPSKPLLKLGVNSPINPFCKTKLY